ncbi:MAG: radical SAM protein [candidate division WOR-3 bacterium]
MFIKENYFFDSKTTILVKLASPISDIIRFASKKSDDFFGRIEELPVDLKKRFTQAELLNALKEIEVFKSEYGLFSFARPYFRTVASPFTQEEIEEKLEHNLSHLILNVTQDCNMSCVYCKYSETYPAERAKNTSFMSVEIADRALEFLRRRSEKTGSIRIGFYGGEPLLNFDVIRYVVTRTRRIFSQKKVYFSLTTNGLLLSEQGITDFLVENDFYLKVSLDGYKEVHDRYRVSKGKRGTFDLVYRNLVNLKERYNKYFLRNVGYTITLAPPYDLKGVKEFIEKSEISTHAPIMVSLVDPLGTDFYLQFCFEDLSVFDKQLDEIITEEKELWRKGHFSPFLDSLVYKDLVLFHSRLQGDTGDVLYPSGMCIPGFERTFVDVNGDISPCERVHYHVLIGNVKDGFDYQKIKRVVDLLVKKRERCKDCEIAKICSLCFAGTFVHGEFSEENFETLCSSRKKRWQKLLNIYIDILETNQNFFDFVGHVDGADEKG